MSTTERHRDLEMVPDQRDMPCFGLKAPTGATGEYRNRLSPSSFTPRGFGGKLQRSSRDAHTTSVFHSKVSSSFHSSPFSFPYTLPPAFLLRLHALNCQRASLLRASFSSLYHLRCIPRRISCQPGSFAASRAQNVPRSVPLSMRNPR
jgi:hypothetical protein